MAKNPKITKQDPRILFKRCLDEDNDSIRAQLVDGSVTARVELSSESMSVLAQDEQGNKKPLLVSPEGKLLVELPKMEAVEQPKLECKHEVSLQPLPQEYLKALADATAALKEVALSAGKETVREVPVEKVVEKHVVTKEVPKLIWILIGAQAAALLISVL